MTGGLEHWSAEPVPYLTNRRFVERTNAITDIKLYSNGESPELFVNGASKGQRGDGTNGVFIWKSGALQPGVNKVFRHGAQGRPNAARRLPLEFIATTMTSPLSQGCPCPQSVMGGQKRVAGKEDKSKQTKSQSNESSTAEPAS